MDQISIPKQRADLLQFNPPDEHQWAGLVFCNSRMNYSDFQHTRLDLLFCRQLDGKQKAMSRPWQPAVTPILASDGRRRAPPAGRSSAITDMSYPVPILFTFERAGFVITSNQGDDKKGRTRRWSAAGGSSVSVSVTFADLNLKQGMQKEDNKRKQQKHHEQERS